MHIRYWIYFKDGTISKLNRLVIKDKIVTEILNKIDNEDNNRKDVIKKSNSKNKIVTKIQNKIDLIAIDNYIENLFFPILLMF